MWSVIRKTQGIPPNEDVFASEPADRTYERHQRCVLMHEAKREVPFIDPKIMSRAYGDLHYEKVRRWLLDDDAHLRTQAVDQLIELFTEKREHRAKSLRYNTLPILFSMLCADGEEVLRERSGVALEMLVQEPSAQDRILRSASAQTPALATAGLFAATPTAAAAVGDGDLLKRLMDEALGDSCDRVVVQALRVMVASHSYVNSFALTQHMVELGSVHRLLGLVEHGTSDLVRAVACSALVPVFDVKEAHIIFQRAGGMRVATTAVRGAVDDMLVGKAAEVISRAAEWPQGKRDAVSNRSIAALLPHIRHPNLSVRVAVVEALAQITVWEPARFQALESSELTDAVNQLLAEEDERDVIAQLAKLIYHLAEHPGGRAALRACKPRFAELLGFADSDDVSVRLALENGIELLSRK